jgi:acyl carrier protein
MEQSAVEGKVADIVCRLANLATLAPEQDYFDAGLASVQALELLLEVESEFGVSLPDDQFASVRNVRQLAGLITGRDGQP